MASPSWQVRHSAQGLLVVVGQVVCGVPSRHVAQGLLVVIGQVVCGVPSRQVAQGLLVVVGQVVCGVPSRNVMLVAHLPQPQARGAMYSAQGTLVVDGQVVCGVPTNMLITSLANLPHQQHSCQGGPNTHYQAFSSQDAAR